MFLLSLIILIFFTTLVYIPLRKITMGAEKFADGNYHYEVNVDSRDEMGYLAAALNYMSGKIADSEDDQKKFIAISRFPVASYFDKRISRSNARRNHSPRDAREISRHSFE